ncbi:hypothetical protein Tco_1555749 [Tanacetum coccineum]
MFMSISDSEIVGTSRLPDTYSVRGRFGGVTDWYQEQVIENQVVETSYLQFYASSDDSMGTTAGRFILFGTFATTIPDTTPVITPPNTQTDTTVIPTETPIIAPTIPPSPDYTPASHDYSPASDSDDTPDTPPSPTHGTPFTEITSSTQRSPVIPRFEFDSSTGTNLFPWFDHHSSPDLPSTSVGPSRKRRRSPMTYVPALPHVFRALSPVRADLIPSPKRIRSLETTTDLESCSEDSFEPYVPREVGLGVDVEDESSEQSRASGVDVRVEVVTVSRDDVETGMRDPIVVSNDGDTPPVVPEVIPEPTQEGAAGNVAEVERDIQESGHRGVGGQRVDRSPAATGRCLTPSGAFMTHEEVEDWLLTRLAEEMAAR